MSRLRWNIRARSLPKLRLVERRGREIAPGGNDAASVSLKSGDALRPLLVVGADGRKSISRQAAGIAIDERSYPQSCSHPLPAAFPSTPRHVNGISYLIRSVYARHLCRKADRVSFGFSILPRLTSLTARDGADLAAEISVLRIPSLARSNSNQDAVWLPLHARHGAGASRTSGSHSVGEAAHVIPPIGAQGLNLGLRDAATIGELAVAAQRDGRDIGGADVLARLRQDAPDRRRQPDSCHRPVQPHATERFPAGTRACEAWVFICIDRIGPLRRAVMREGVAPAAAQPD